MGIRGQAVASEGKCGWRLRPFSCCSSPVAATRQAPAGHGLRHGHLGWKAAGRRPRDLRAGRGGRASTGSTNAEGKYELIYIRNDKGAKLGGTSSASRHQPRRQRRTPPRPLQLPNHAPRGRETGQQRDQLHAHLRRRAAIAFPPVRCSFPRKPAALRLVGPLRRLLAGRTVRLVFAGPPPCRSLALALHGSWSTHRVFANFRLQVGGSGQVSAM